MEEACRLIIKKAIDNNISTKKELEKLKIQTCRELNLPGFMSKIGIIEANIDEKTIQNYFGSGNSCSYV